jgi:pyruvate dehydrogenase E1 component
MHPEEAPRAPYASTCFGKSKRLFVAASDHVKALPLSIARWLPGPLHALGTDGFGRSESRAALRDYFEVDARYVTLAALGQLAQEGTIEASVPAQAMKDLDLNSDKGDPVTH